MSSDTTEKMSSSATPVGIILVKDEPDEHILIKWLGWMIVMVTFVLILIWTTKYFNAGDCYHGTSEGFVLKQERDDYAAYPKPIIF